MSRIAIRCHPCAPVATEELEQWLGQEVERLRAGAPQAVLRLARLVQRAQTGDLEIGWLIELDAANDEPPLADRALAAVVRDLRLLGLQPTVLRSLEGEPAASVPVGDGASAQA